jgi:hypothetical protein
LSGRPSFRTFDRLDEGAVTPSWKRWGALHIAHSSIALSGPLWDARTRHDVPAGHLYDAALIRVMRTQYRR